MILYIFNNPFPDNAGFSKRCLKEIEVLSKKEEIVVLCKKELNEKSTELINVDGKQIQIKRFTSIFNSNQKINSYQILKGFYEITRNLDLSIGMVLHLIRILWKHRKNDPKMYVIVSPLTVPLIALICSKFIRAIPFAVEFHDLEPELAMHIKDLDKKSFITKIEFFLEKIICNSFKKVIVTTTTQAKRIMKRTKISKNKIEVIPNSLQVAEAKVSIKNVTSNKFNVGYISSFTFKYSISVLHELIKTIAKTRAEFEGIEFTIVGDGTLLIDIKKTVKDLDLSPFFTFTGNIDNVSHYLNKMDVTLIPWESNDMTETMAPTKLFEYMYAKKAIIAPNFGEFKEILTHNRDSLLYSSIDQLVKQIKLLQKDKLLRESLANSAYNKYIEYYSGDIVSNKLVNFIYE